LHPDVGAGRTRWNASETELTAASVPALTEQWSATIGGRVNAPVSIGGSVYVTDIDGTVAALGAASGTPRWTLETGASSGAPSYSDGELLVPTSTLSPFAGNAARAYDPTTGAQHDSIGGRLLAVADGEPVVEIQLGGPGNWYVEIAWGDHRHPVDFTGPQSVSIVDDTILWVSSAVRGYAPDCPLVSPFPASCSPNWTYSTGAAATGVAATSGTTAVVSDTAGMVDGIDVRTGARLWRAAVGAGVTGPPAVVDGTVFVATTDGRLVALAADGCGGPTCSALWQAPLPAAPSTGPVAGGDVVYATTTGGDITAYPAAGCGAATCSSLVTVSVGAEVTGGPIVDEGRLVAGTADGRVVAFGLPG
jgi:outer membrane protein assembly factor BamB